MVLCALSYWESRFILHVLNDVTGFFASSLARGNDPRCFSISLFTIDFAHSLLNRETQWILAKMDFFGTRKFMYDLRHA